MKLDRIILYENILAVLFMIGIILDIINEKLLYGYLPSEFVGYFFWFSLGAYLGFKICKIEFKKRIKNG